MVREWLRSPVQTHWTGGLFRVKEVSVGTEPEKSVAESGAGRGENAPASKDDGPGGRSPGNAGRRGWIYAKRPVLGFVLLFGVLMAAFYACTFPRVVSNKLIPAYMRLNARASVAIINVFGEGATAKGTRVSSPRFSVDILHGCDAIAPSALFIAAVLAFPASMRSKLPVVVVGTLFLAVINLARIVTLFFTGIYYPKWFQAAHVDVWQPFFILLALALWVVWACWATRSKVVQPDVPSEAD